MKTKILVVEDDPAERALFGRILASSGHSVLVAENARKALELVERRPDVILLDYLLPDMAGAEVCQRLREHPNARQVPIVVITGDRDSQTEIDSMRFGADAFLKKPISNDALLAHIESHLRRRGLQKGRSVTVQGLEISPKEQIVRWQGLVVDRLAPREIDVLFALVKGAPKILSRNALFELIYGRNARFRERAVDVTIARLKRKLPPRARGLIENIRGEGYRFRTGINSN